MTRMTITYLLVALTLFIFMPQMQAQETHHWETIVFPFHTWHYREGTADIPDDWKEPGFDASSWDTGRGGIGYGDDDDETVIGETISLYMRLDFNVKDKNDITDAVLNADYDDGFVAYLNGFEIARSNIGTPGVLPAWDETTPENHEAQMYQGGNPEYFNISTTMLDSVLRTGKNTLAFQVHNRGISSSDLSSIFYFSVGITLPELQYMYPPGWFYAPIESSNLPLMMIDTHGQGISRGDRIIADMGLMDYSSLGERNFLSDTFNIYRGRISIKVRGASSLGFPKKNYTFETQEENGENRNISLLGMPEENDWVLHGPYSDKTLIRNVLSYHIAAMTGRYAPRTRWIELFINEQYQGVYVLTEKIKQDDNRVDIARLYPQDTTGDELSGGYIVQLDRGEDPGWQSSFRPNVTYKYYDPDYEELVPDQRIYIRVFFERFENAVQYNSESDFISRIDVGSWVDYWIATEIYNHVDGYKFSFYLYKRKDSEGGKLNFGPVWDLNLAYGNSDFGPEPLPSGWSWELAQTSSIRPFWVYDIMQTDTVRNFIACRWKELRQGPLQTDSLLNFINVNLDYIEEARIRNFQRWPVLGVYVWPNYYVGTDYKDEVIYLTDWLRDRLTWMDENMVGNCIPVYTDDHKVFQFPVNVFPNPFNDRVSFSFNKPDGPVRIEIFNSSAILLRSFKIENPYGKQIYLGDLNSGLYFYRIISSDAVVASGKLVKE